MQTFLPWPDFRKSAESLDRQRLGKQRLEAWQLYGTLTNARQGWKNHPAQKMWLGHDRALLEYGRVICEVWIERGYKDTLKQRFEAALETLGGPSVERPAWFGLEAFHRSHQSNLIRKLPEYYRLQFPNVPDDLPYVWPVE